MKNLYLLSTKPTAEEDENDTNEVQEINNSIFFYTDVTKQSALNLNQKLKKLGTELTITGVALDIPTPDLKLHINSNGGSLLDGFAAVEIGRAHV